MMTTTMPTAMTPTGRQIIAAVEAEFSNVSDADRSIVAEHLTAAIAAEPSLEGCRAFEKAAVRAVSPEGRRYARAMMEQLPIFLIGR